MVDRGSDHTQKVVESALHLERHRLVRLCARLTGNRHVAEDLAQEAIVEAWRSAATLRDPEAVSAWLSGIARNVCRQWTREHAREMRRRAPDEDNACIHSGVASQIADAAEIEIDLERDELARLLDRALALLPLETRRILLARFVDESSYSEIADQFGLSEGTAMVRIHRAKLRLRRLLTNHFYAEASAYGLVGGASKNLETMDLFCPLCGRAHLVGRFNAASGEFVLRCPECQAGRPETVANAINHTTMQVTKDAGSYRVALVRVMDWIYDYYATSAVRGSAACLNCGEPIRLKRVNPSDPAPDAPWWFRRSRGFYTLCHACGKTSAMGIRSLARCSPAGSHFWQRHRRIRTLPVRDIEWHRGPAVLVSLEAITDRSRLDLIFDAETHQLLDSRDSLGD